MKCSNCYAILVSTYRCRYCPNHFCSLSCLDYHCSKSHPENNITMMNIPQINSPYLIYGIINNSIIYDSFYSLKNLYYDKNLYDIYVIADNYTDNTAQIAKEAGAIVYERFDEEKKTKVYALDWFLQQKIRESIFKESEYEISQLIKGGKKLVIDYIKRIKIENVLELLNFH